MSQEAYVVIEVFSYEPSDNGLEDQSQGVDTVHLTRQTADARVSELIEESKGRLGNEDEDGMFWNAVGYDAFAMPVPLVRE
jgi:hypothetical protein